MKKCLILMLAIMLTLSAMVEGSDNAAYVRERLTELGYYSSGETDDSSDAAQIAIKNFQLANGLSATGDADADTLSAMKSENAVSRRDFLVGLAQKYAEVKTVEKGNKGEEVLSVQKKLSELGYLTAGNDGDFGDATLMAVKRFQIANGVRCTGKVDSETRFRLFEGDAYSWSDWLASMCLSKGASGANVRTLQKRLKELGYYGDAPSGVYGDTTQQAVSAFQSANRLDATGNVDTYTCEALFSANSVAGAVSVDSRSSEEIGAIQSRLWELGYFESEFTDEYDYATETAVRLFQMAVGMNMTGTLDDETYKRITDSNAMPLSNAREALRSKLRETTADALSTALRIATGLLGKSFEPNVDAEQCAFDLLRYVYVSAGIPVVSEEDILILAQMNTAGAPVVLSPEDGSVMSISNYDGNVIFARDGYVLEGLPETVA